jgi:small subunit ribosomal protein S6
MGRKEIGALTTYEILLLLDPEQADAHQDDIVSRARDLVEKSGGTWHSHDAWGRRRLAYPIGHKEEGVYHLVVFDTEADTLDEISRVLKIDDAVLRHMATRHIAGSRTSAPRDDAAAPVAAPVADAAPQGESPATETTPADDAGSTAAEAAGDRPELAGAVAEEEYAGPNTGSDEPDESEEEE